MEGKGEGHILAIRRRFRDEGIEIPFPICTVIVKNEQAEALAPAAEAL